MNNFKFSDCRDCLHVGRGTNNRFCRNCDAGENFEERLENQLDFGGDDDLDHGVCDYD